jgi:hypothetical protein
MDKVTTPWSKTSKEEFTKVPLLTSLGENFKYSTYH